MKITFKLFASLTDYLPQQHRNANQVTPVSYTHLTLPTKA